MALDINALKNAWKQKSEKQSEGGNTGFWDKFYPFYKMATDQTARFRLLPDADEENPLQFVVENIYHELVINGKKKKVGCSKMYGESCPCCELSKKYYDEGDTALGKTFWKKTDYIAQGLIIDSPFDHPMEPEKNPNPVRLISIGKKLYKAIENGIVKGDLDEMPTDLENGYDLMINKTASGEYADYSSSNFARKSTPVPAKFLEGMELYELKKFRFAQVERTAMEAMCEAVLTGKSYDDAHAPAEGSVAAVAEAVSSPKTTAPAETLVSAPAPVASAPAPAAEATATKKLSPAEILKQLKEKSAAAKG